MKKSCAFIVFLLAILISLPAYSDDKVTIAVLDLNPKGVPKIVANAVSDIIRSEFVNIGNFTVVERSQMNAIMEEQGLQMTGCTDSSCAVQFGKILSAERIVVGEVNAIGKAAFITIRYVDVVKGSSMFSAKARASSLDTIDSAAEKVARKLAQRIVEEDKDILTRKSPTEYYVRSIVPGLGQFYADRTVKGIVFASTFVLAGAFSYFAWADFKKKDDAYHDLNRGSTEFNDTFDEYETAGKYFYYSLALVGFVYVVHWVDVLFFSAPDFSGAGEDKAETASCNFYKFNLCSVSGFAPEKGASFSVGVKF